MAKLAVINREAKRRELEKRPQQAAPVDASFDRDAPGGPD